MKRANHQKILPKKWLTTQQEPLACKEKIELLNENIFEILNLAEEILDESILMGVDPKQTKSIIKKAIDNISSDLKSD